MTIKNKFSFKFVVTVNDDECLKNNLLQSQCVNSENLIIQRAFSSAAAAINNAVDKYCDTEYVIFVHQDVYLPADWLDNLRKTIETLNVQDDTWAVIGVAGTNLDGNIIGRLWSQGIEQEINSGQKMEKVRSLDEVILVLKKKTGLRFDEHIAGYHLYGTDIVQQAILHGHNCYCVHMPIIHNDKKKYILDGSYHEAYKLMKKKWRNNLPIATTVIPITRHGLEYYYRNMKQLRRKLLDLCMHNVVLQCDDPKEKSRQLSYEK